MLTRNLLQYATVGNMYIYFISSFSGNVNRFQTNLLYLFIFPVFYLGPV